MTTTPEIPRLDIVVPCFNEEAALVDTEGELRRVLQQLVNAREVAETSRVVFVDDGSRDRTWEVICSCAAQHACVAGVRLSNNRGHQNALLAGIGFSDADAILTIDADLQDDVGVFIPAMVRG